MWRQRRPKSREVESGDRLGEYSLRPDVGPELGEAVLAALEKDPARRPESAGAYASLLASARENGA